MRKSNLFSAVHSLFLHVPASIIGAQKLLFPVICLFALNSQAQVTKTLNGVVRYESGMSTSKLSTPNGNVVVNLPQAMSGAVITGTVSTQPAGKTEKEKNKNLKELMKMVLNLDGQKIPLSASPTNFNWLTHGGQQSRTPVELLNVSGAKVAEVSLPPVLSSPSPMGGWGSNAGPVLSTPSNVLVKGDALNIYTDQQFKPGEKFILTDSKGKHFTLSPVCLSSQQAVMNMPDEVSPGNCSVSSAGLDAPILDDNPNRAFFNLIDINLSSPNTNLRPGEGSYVLASVIWDNRFTGEFEYYSIDLRNLNPNTVTMEGGNLQRVNVSSDYSRFEDDTPNDPAHENFQIRRNITGVKPGGFSVSATLHEDYSTSNDPFRPQLNVLKTPEDFNAWANALKKDLKEYAGIHDNDLLGQVVKTNAQRAIDNMPVCSDPGQLDESKAVIYSLLQPLQVPKGAAISWLSNYEALIAAIKAIDNNVAGNTTLIDYDVLKNGIEFIKRVGNSLKDPALQTEAANVQQLIDQVQTTSETKENLQDLKNKTNALITKAGMKIKTDEEIIIKTGMKGIIMSSYQLPSNAQPGRPHPFNDLVGVLDPVKKTLSTTPEYKQQILNSLNAVEQPDGSYRIQSMTPSLKPISYLIRVFASPPQSDFDPQEWRVKWLTEQTMKDSNAGKVITTFKDSTGTWYRFFKDAKCDTGGEGHSLACLEKTDFIWKEDGSYEEKKTGKYVRLEFPPLNQCKKGTEFCTEVFQVWRIQYNYSDKGCTILTSVETEYEFGCK